MTAVRVLFKTLNEGDQPPPGYQYMKCHMIFDIKLDGFRRKARLLGEGCMVKDKPSIVTYVSFVSRETVRIALTIAALNDLEFKASDVMNSFLTAPCAENIWTTLGPEFGDDMGKKAVIVRALYGLKSAGANFGNHITDCMHLLGYEPCRTYPTLWFKTQVRSDDGFECYEYVLLYVNGILKISHDAMAALYWMDKFFMMMKGSIEDPDIYLGAEMSKVQLNNGVFAWGMIPAKYVQEEVINIEGHITKEYGGGKLPKRATSPWPLKYLSETDMTPE